jgi:trans-2,3-dihydro-3-hydroxyanthranilate isomerase
MIDEQLAALARFHPLGHEGSGALRYLVVDAFAEAPLAGNPVAVFTDASDLDATTMQRLARELNLSESVFLGGASQGGDMRARIFTPSQELPFAGHPILGAAVVAAFAIGAGEVTLETGAGPVRVDLAPSGRLAAVGRMRQPLPTHEPFARTAELLQALGLERARLPVELYTNGPRHVMVALWDEREVAELRPDITALAHLDAVGVSCFAGAASRWKTRMFAPGLGVSEDPATGSAAGPLAVHLARHGDIGFGEEIEIRQGAEIGRPSLLHAVAHGTAERLERVEVAGRAVIVAEGSFLI